jgi:hypothetical protein
MRSLQLSLARLLCRIANLAVLGLLVFVGVDLINGTETYATFFPESRWLPIRGMDEVGRLIFAAACILSPLTSLAMGWIVARLERGIVGKGSDGSQICLTSEAISRTVIREIKAQVEEVVKVRSCEAWQASGGPRVILNISISDRAQVPAVQAKAKEVVAETLRQLIGYANTKHVIVKVSEIAGAPGTPGTSRRNAGKNRPEGDKAKLRKEPATKP